MKTKSRSYILDHSNNSQTRVRCSANLQLRVEQRPFQRYLQTSFINYEQHKRQMNQGKSEKYQMPSPKIDSRPLVVCVPRLFDCGTVFGYQILVRGSKGYY